MAGFSSAQLETKGGKAETQNKVDPPRLGLVTFDVCGDSCTFWLMSYALGAIFLAEARETLGVYCQRV
jgi:hypothetical protein